RPEFSAGAVRPSGELQGEADLTPERVDLPVDGAIATRHRRLDEEVACVAAAAPLDGGLCRATDRIRVGEPRAVDDVVPSVVVAGEVQDPASRRTPVRLDDEITAVAFDVEFGRCDRPVQELG